MRPQRQGDDLIVNRLELDERGLKLILEHPAIAVMAEHAAALLEGWDAKNYVQFDLMPRPDRTQGRCVRVTVQWAHGLSPSEKNVFLETALRDILTEANSGVLSPNIRIIAKLALDGVNWREVME